MFEKIWDNFVKIMQVGTLCCFVGMLYAHRRVIKALLTGSPMPEMPVGHPVCHKKREVKSDV